MPACIPYGACWSKPFARWQVELAHLHSMKFAAHVASHLFNQGVNAVELLRFEAQAVDKLEVLIREILDGGNTDAMVTRPLDREITAGPDDSGKRGFAKM